MLNHLWFLICVRLFCLTKCDPPRSIKTGIKCFLFPIWNWLVKTSKYHLYYMIMPTSGRGNLFIHSTFSSLLMYYQFGKQEILHETKLSDHRQFYIWTILCFVKTCWWRYIENWHQLVETKSRQQSRRRDKFPELWKHFNCVQVFI